MSSEEYDFSSRFVADLEDIRQLMGAGSWTQDEQQLGEQVIWHGKGVTAYSTESQYFPGGYTKLVIDKGENYPFTKP